MAERITVSARAGTEAGTGATVASRQVSRSVR